MTIGDLWQEPFFSPNKVSQKSNDRLFRLAFLRQAEKLGWNIISRQRVFQLTKMFFETASGIFQWNKSMVLIFTPQKIFWLEQPEAATTENQSKKDEFDGLDLEKVLKKCGYKYESYKNFLVKSIWYRVVQF